MRVFSFQKEKVTNKLLNNGKYINFRGDARRKDKTSFYRELLKIEEYPIYTFAKIVNGNEDCSKYPINLDTFRSNWSELMGYYKLSGRDILELEIPLNEGVIGCLDDNEDKCRLTSLDEDCTIEFVVPLLKLEWVKAIYQPDNRYKGYDRTTYSPIYTSRKNILFPSPISFSGNGYGDDYEAYKNDNYKYK